jgi:hypothetical protein
MDINHLILAQSFLTGQPMLSQLMEVIAPFMVFMLIVIGIASVMGGI